MFRPDVINDILQARLPEQLRLFIQLVAHLDDSVSNILDAIKPIPVETQLPIDFDVPPGLATVPTAGYSTSSDVTITNILLSSDVIAAVNIYLGEANIWLPNIRMAANSTIILKLDGELARMAGRGTRILAVTSAGVLTCHMWGRTS